VSRDLAEIVPNGSVVKAISDMMSLPLEVHDAVRVERLRSRLGQLGQAEMGSRVAAARKAEVIYDIQREEDWKQIVDPRTNRPYRTWVHFREKLALMFSISTGSIGDYLAVVRMARSVFGVGSGDLPVVGGLTTVRACSRLFAGTDGRSSDDIRRTLRPVSKEAEFSLVKAFGEPAEREDGLSPWLDHAKRSFHQDYAHDLVDPTAINKSPAELNEQARQQSGRPRVTYEWADNDARHIRWSLEYAPHTNEDGSVVETRDSDSGMLRLEKFVPTPVREDLERKLRLG